MSQVLSIRDGETYCGAELQASFGFKTERAFKSWVGEMGIPYVPVQGRWWFSGEDVRKALRLAAMTQSERREAKAEA